MLQDKRWLSLHSRPFPVKESLNHSLKMRFRVLLAWLETSVYELMMYPGDGQTFAGLPTIPLITYHLDASYALIAFCKLKL